jgi:L-threonylcarbamoyladenylate synthase
MLTVKENADVEKAVSLLKSKKIVAIPTETVYGLAADARSETALAKIFAAKNRPAFDPLILHFYDKEAITPYVIEPAKLFDTLYQKFCPGPITFILSKKSTVPHLATAGHATVAVRFPQHPLAQAVLKQCGFPLAAPSANLFGKVSPTKASHVSEQLGSRVDYILDGGPCAVGLESTIIDLSTTKPTILRLGGLSLEELENALGEKIQTIKTSSSNPKAPGMLSAHYSPDIRLLHGNLIQNLKLINPAKTGTLTFCQKVGGIPLKNQRILSPKGNLVEAASQLFTSLNSFKNSGLEVILAEKFPNEGLGRAINDRLKRASVG